MLPSVAAAVAVEAAVSVVLVEVEVEVDHVVAAEGTSVQRDDVVPVAGAGAKAGAEEVTVAVTLRLKVVIRKNLAILAQTAVIQKWLRAVSSLVTCKCLM